MYFLLLNLPCKFAQSTKGDVRLSNKCSSNYNIVAKLS